MTKKDPIRKAIAKAVAASGGKHQPIEVAAGVSNKTLTRCLDGTYNTGLDTIYKLCRALGLTITVKASSRRRA